MFIEQIPVELPVVCENIDTNRNIYMDLFGASINEQYYVITLAGLMRADLYLPSQYQIFQSLYHYMRNLCNLIGLEQWYFSLI